MTQSLAIVIPVKCPSKGKSRLSSVMTAEQRFDLNWWLINSTFDQVASLLELARVYVVSESDDVLRAAKARGFESCRESPSTGLNAAIEIGAEQSRQDRMTQIMVLPVDLPYLTAQHLLHVIDDARNGHDVVIVVDQAGSGTNLMLWKPLTSAEFHYGPGSAVVHADIASKRGLRVLVRQDAELSFDLDTPDDWRNWSLARGAAKNESQ